MRARVCVTIVFASVVVLDIYLHSRKVIKQAARSDGQLAVNRHYFTCLQALHTLAPNTSTSTNPDPGRILPKE